MVLWLLENARVYLPSIWIVLFQCFTCWPFHTTLQLRLESIESINKILEEANKRIQAAGTGMLLSVLHPWAEL